ncbi:MAG: hypothetical protein ACI38U_14370 [Corynebacterium sp.]|uniref:hypothetical protein n=1 Tax=Corynebacterium sp. TaxID=1720 RepID=UPI003F0D9406
MTVLHGYLHDIAGTAFDQQGTAVVISATKVRPAMEGEGLVLRELARIEMEDSDGKFQTPDLDPGPVVVRLEGGVSHGQSWEIGIPMEGRWNLADLIGEQVEWEPIVVSRAEAAARDSREQADRSESEADRSERAADRVGSAERVLQAEATSVQAEVDALAHRDEAKAQADRSESEADRSQGQADASAVSAGESFQSAVDADARAKDADEHRIDAQAAAVATGEDRVAVREDRLATGRARNEAQDAATRSDGRATDAETAATTAGEHETGAKQAVDDAVAEATSITAGHAEAAEGAAGRAATSAREGKGYRDEAREAAQQAGDIATGDLPAASNAARGLIRMAGDLAGSGDDPRVPGLAMTAPGAALHLEPTSTGWSNATDDPVSSSTGWVFDGEWLRPPHWLGEVFVTVDWCGASAVSLRGRRADNTAVTLATVAAGEQDTHRQVVARVDLTENFEVAVAGTWEQGDLDAGCRVTLFVQPVPAHSHRIDDVEGLRSALGSKVEGNDDRLTDARPPTEHQHDIGGPAGVRGLRDELDAVRALATRGGVWFSGEGPPPDPAPEGSQTGDFWLNELTTEYYKWEDDSDS